MNSISFLSIRDVSTDKRASLRACVRRRGSCKKGGRSTTYEIEWGGGGASTSNNLLQSDTVAGKMNGALVGRLYERYAYVSSMAAPGTVCRRACATEMRLKRSCDCSDSRQERDIND